MEGCYHNGIKYYKKSKEQQTKYGRSNYRNLPEE